MDFYARQSSRVAADLVTKGCDLGGRHLVDHNLGSGGPKLIDTLRPRVCVRAELIDILGRMCF